MSTTQELIADLKAVLCGPDGKCCIPGSQADREIIDTSIEALSAEVERLKKPKEKIAPVQGWPQGIPWSLHLEAYAVYCQKYGAQQALIDLEGRNCRGGFGVGELDQFIPGWRERVSELAAVKAERDQLRAQLEAQGGGGGVHGLAHQIG